MRRQHDEVVTLGEPGVDDAEALARLFDEDMKELGEEVSFEAQRELARQVISGMAREDRDCLCWVARRDELVVGVILANFNWSPKFGGRALWIESLYVTQSGRRRGVGRRLVDQLLDWAEEHGIKGVDIEAYRGNTPAGVLYRSLGFHRLGRERFAYRLDE